jgi:tetratricopeptide (TPR) repeat protein
MVQSVARQRLEAVGEAARVLQRAHAMVEAAFPKDRRSPSSWAACGLLFPHVAALQQSWATVPGSAAFDPTRLWAAAGFFAWAAGRSGEALALMVEVVEVCRRVLGEEHPETLTSLNNLAETRRALGDAEGARELHEQVVAVRRRVLGEEHPDTLTSLNNLAATLFALGDAEGARELHEQVVAVRRRVLGEEHPATLNSLNNLAAAHFALGDTEGARELVEQVVAVSRRVLGEKHPVTLTSLNNLAATRRALGDAEGAPRPKGLAGPSPASGES